MVTCFALLNHNSGPVREQVRARACCPISIQFIAVVFSFINIREPSRTIKCMLDKPFANWNLNLVCLTDISIPHANFTVVNIWHRGNTLYDVTVTGQWSSPSACLPSKVLRSIERRKDRYSRGLRTKNPWYFSFFCSFDLLNRFLTLKKMFAMNSGTGKPRKSFCVV